MTLTKFVAGALTVAMLALFTWQDLWGFAVAYSELATSASAATSEEELAAGATGFSRSSARSASTSS